MKRIISTVSAAAVLAGALLLPAALRAEDKAEAKPAAHGEKGGKEGFAAHMREKFGISEEQEAKLKVARRAKRDASAAARAELGTAVSKLQDQLEDKAPEKDLAASLDKIAALRKAERAEEEKFEASLSSILTPTQRAKMVVAMKMHAHGGRGMGGRMGGGKRGGMHGGMRGGKGAEKKDEDDSEHED